MSHSLSCDFLVESERGPVYWWPLIFEAMLRSHFSFFHPDPDYIKGICNYSSLRWGESLSIHHRSGSFKELWDEIYAERNDLVSVTFWSSTQDELVLTISITTPKEHPLVPICLDAGAEPMGYPLHEAKARLNMVLDCAKTLYQTCRPCTGEFYWEHAGVAFAPWAALGKRPAEPSEERPQHVGPPTQLLRQTLPDDEGKNLGAFDAFVWLDPVPIPAGGGDWKFVSLLG
jgi:hypothetical protein